MSDAQDLRKRIAEDVAFLASFRADILAHHEGHGGTTVRSRINRGMARARSIVTDSGVLKSVMLSPPPAIGGLLVRNADPFNCILESYYGMSMAPTVADMIEEAIGVLESPEYSRACASKVPHGRTRDTRSPKEPEIPGKITILWLVQKVPVGFWFWLLGLLAAAFAAGVKFGPLIVG